MASSGPGAPVRARGVLAAVLLVVLVVAGGCGKDEEEQGEACGMIDRDLVTKLADGREWRDFGVLYRDGRFTDGCTVLVSGDQLLVVTLIDFRDESDAASARTTVLEERAAVVKSCPQDSQAPVTEDEVTTACLRDEELKYTEWNPRRLVRLTLDRTPAVTPSRKCLNSGFATTAERWR